MNAKNLRRFHLYAGCIFSPALIFFILSGSWQMFRFHITRKDGSYTPPALMKALSSIHTNGQIKGWTEHPSLPFKVFTVVMALFLLFTIAVGLFLAFQTVKEKWKVWACLILGILIPVLLLMFK